MVSNTQTDIFNQFCCFYLKKRPDEIVFSSHRSLSSLTLIVLRHLQDITSVNVPQYVMSINRGGRLVH